MTSLGETFVTKAYDKKGSKMDYGNGMKKRRPAKASAAAPKRMARPAPADMKKPGKTAKKAAPGMAKKAAPMSAAKKAARPMQSSPSKTMPTKRAMPRMGDRMMQGRVMKQWDGRRWVTVG